MLSCQFQRFTSQLGKKLTTLLELSFSNPLRIGSSASSPPWLRNGWQIAGEASLPQESVRKSANNGMKASYNYTLLCAMYIPKLHCLSHPVRAERFRTLKVKLCSKFAPPCTSQVSSLTARQKMTHAFNTQVHQEVQHGAAMRSRRTLSPCPDPLLQT